MHGTLDCIVWLMFLGCLYRVGMSPTRKQAMDWALNAVIVLLIAFLVAVN